MPDGRSWLGDELNRPVNVESRTGAVAGHTAIAAAAPDGLTLGMITGAIGMMHWHENVTALTPLSYTPLAVPYVEAAAVIVRADAPALIFKGTIRPLATMDDQRHPLFPDAPTVKEATGLDWCVADWRGLVAPAGLAPQLRDPLIEALRRIAADESFTAECRTNGYTLGWRFGGDFADYMQEDDEQFGHVIGPEAASQA